jgi:SanA protein
MTSRLKKNCWRFLVVTILLFVITLGINLYIIFSTEDGIVFQIANLPQREFALVLGTEPLRPDGSTNLHFIKRTDLAAKVYLSGKAARLLISGNKNNRGFNEVLEMKNRILSKDIPETALELDFDGNRTWESVRRTKETYHLQKVIIITDAFHAPRAIFLCRHFGIDAVAMCPDKDPFSLWFVRYNVKEYFARLVAVFDIMTGKKHEPNP